MIAPLIVLIAINTATEVNGAKILAVYPSSLTSHHVVFRTLTLELVRRGHEVVVITANSIFPEGQAPKNLTEIDIRNVSHTTWLNNIPQSASEADARQYSLVGNLFATIFEEVLKVEEVQKMIRSGEHFDLLVLESCFRPALIFSHFFKAPVIQISSYYPILGMFEEAGAPSHPLLYPTFIQKRLYNLSKWEKVKVLYNHVRHNLKYYAQEQEENMMLQRFFGKDIPSLRELHRNVDMFFDNLHPIWANNQPQPPSILHIGGIIENPIKELPQDLKDYMDSSKNGIIYISFGTTVIASRIPGGPGFINMLIAVVSRLPYDVLLKWDEDELPSKSQNIRISKWFPQPDLLKHPKVKVFITQAGLQSTEDAIDAGVPVIGIPIIADQFCNAEKYVKFGIGVKLDVNTIKKEDFKNAIENVISNDSYRQNIIRLRNIMKDQPQPPMERAIWWMEYVIRHGGAKHLRAPAAGMSWSEYFELELICILAICLLFCITIFAFIVNYIRSFIRRKVVVVKSKTL